MHKGFYVIFEGNEGAGKTTVMKRVAEELQKKLESIDPQEILLTHQPGSTPLGKHIRQLVKYPQTINDDIVVDDLSRQMLYMIDTINFVKSILEPSLNDNKIIFTDRSTYISAIVYGLSDGLEIRDIEKLFDILIPPRADKLIILQLPATVSKDRLANSRDDDDHYDNKPIEFFEKVSNHYDNLITNSPEQTTLVSRSVSIDDVMYVDATLPLHQVIDIIVKEL